MRSAAAAPDKSGRTEKCIGADAVISSLIMHACAPCLANAHVYFRVQDLAPNTLFANPSESD